MTQASLELADARGQSRAIIIDIGEASCRIVIGGTFGHPVMHVISDEGFPLGVARFVCEPRFEIQKCFDFTARRVGYGHGASRRPAAAHFADSIIWRY